MIGILIIYIHKDALNIKNNKIVLSVILNPNKNKSGKNYKKDKVVEISIIELLVFNL